jgi:predicted N-acyltransferase
MKHKIHYIGNNQNSSFIIAETLCGRHWGDVEEFTSIPKEVTCKSCLNVK